jgi:hypothetical protein
LDVTMIGWRRPWLLDEYQPQVQQDGVEER